MILSVRDEDKPKAVAIARELIESGRKLAATKGTAAALKQAGLECELLVKISEGTPNLLDLILDGGISLMINTPSADYQAELEAARIRRACIETGVPCVTSIDTATAILHAMEVFRDPSRASCLRLEEYLVPR